MKKDKLCSFIRWLFFSLLLIVFYMLMAGGLFKTWRPILIIPLAVSVSMQKGELGASIFGAICGLVIDIAGGGLFGFMGFWLLPGCLFVSLLVSHLIKSNFINFMWLNIVLCVVLMIIEYFFMYILWGVDNPQTVFGGFILLSYLSTIIISPAVYFIVKLIINKTAINEQVHLSNTNENND